MPFREVFVNRSMQRVAPRLVARRAKIFSRPSVFKILFWSALALVFFLAILPQRGIGALTNDKIEHFCVFAFLTFLACSAWPSASRRIAVLLAMFGLSIELVQRAWVLLGRDGNWPDWVVDVLAIATVCILYDALRLWWRRRVKFLPNVEQAVDNGF